MTKGLLRSIKRGGAAAPIQRVNIPLSFSLTNIDGASGVGWDTAVISDFPEGNVLLLGAVLNLTATEAHANIINTFSGNVSVGTTATADATLATTEVDIIPSTAFGPAVSSSAPVRAVSTASIGGSVLDNTDGSLEINVNVTIADASIDADNTTMSFAGTLSLVYVMLQDD